MGIRNEHFAACSLAFAEKIWYYIMLDILVKMSDNTDWAMRWTGTHFVSLVVPRSFQTSVVQSTRRYSNALSDQSLCLSLEYSTDQTSLEVSKLKRRLQRLV